MYNVLEEFSSILGVNKGNTVFMDKSEATKLRDLLPKLKEMKERSLLFELFKLQDHPLPLELLHILHTEDVLLLTTYLYLRTEDVEDEITSSLVYLVTCSNLDSSLKIVFCDILRVLYTIDVQSLPQVSLTAESILNSFLEKVCSMLLETHNVWNYLEDILAQRPVFAHKLRSFLVNHLTALLCCKKEHIATELASSVQLQKCVSRKSGLLASFFNALFKGIGRNESFAILIPVITSNQFNWISMLLAISAYCNAYPEEASQKLKTLVDALLQKGLTEKSRTVLSIALLIARQCCLEEIHSFQSYAQWFGSVRLNTRQDVQFFYTFLEEMVPFEPVMVQKIQISKTPLIPPKCQAFVTNYSSLVKARLSELNESLDYLGLFNECHLLEEKKTSDIDRVLDYFQRTGEIMSVVLEASIFRKQYYMKTFLPHLLATTEKEISDREYRETKMKFIEKLRNVGKVPRNLYHKWACENNASVKSA